MIFRGAERGASLRRATHPPFIGAQARSRIRKYGTLNAWLVREERWWDRVSKGWT